MFYFIVLCAAAVLAIIPANIAKDKGYSFGLWWFYGWMLFIVAIIHVSLLPDKSENLNAYGRSSSIPYVPPTSLSAADELKQYKELLDQGVITADDYEAKKKQIMGI
jgi:hypothetical protein